MELIYPIFIIQHASKYKHIIHAMGKQCKDVSGGLPTFISPWIDGKKAIMGTGKLTNDQAVSVAEHETNCGTSRHHTRQAQQKTLPTI